MPHFFPMLSLSIEFSYSCLLLMMVYLLVNLKELFRTFFVVMARGSFLTRLRVARDALDHLIPVYNCLQKSHRTYLS